MKVIVRDSPTLSPLTNWNCGMPFAWGCSSTANGPVAIGPLLTMPIDAVAGSPLIGGDGLNTIGPVNPTSMWAGSTVTLRICSLLAVLVSFTVLFAFACAMLRKLPACG